MLVFGLQMEERPPPMEVSCSRGQITRDGLPAWGLGVGLTTPNRKKNLLRKLLKSLGPGRIFWINDPSYGIWIWDLALRMLEVCVGRIPEEYN
jgi:hypothetical protein